jgi:hypothetical protein
MMLAHQVDALDALTSNEFVMGDHHFTLQVLADASPKRTGDAAAGLTFLVMRQVMPMAAIGIARSSRYASLPTEPARTTVSATAAAAST